MPTVVIHIQNEDAVLGEVDSLPTGSELTITIKSPRKRDGKDLPYVDPSVSTVIWPMARINFIEVMPIGSEEEIISHVRE
jgi:hypothetical protein